MIVSKLDQRVIEGQINGEGKVMTKIEGNPSQEWIKIQKGSIEKYFNVKTKLPLFVNSNDEWIFDSEQRIVEAKNKAKALDRGWTQADGQIVTWWSKHGFDTQKFSFEKVLS